MANFGKHLKEQFRGIGEGVANILRIRSMTDIEQHLHDFMTGMMGGIAAIAGLGVAAFAAPLLTFGLYAAAATAAYAVGYARNREKPSPGGLQSAFIGPVAGVFAGVYAARSCAALVYAAVGSVGALTRVCIDATKDKSVSFRVELPQGAATPAPAQKSLPAPATPDFVIAAAPRPEREVLQVTVERVNDKIRKI